ncbi:MAG: Hsp20/alpha crystallin family protein [Nitrososphaeraceae archaeon]|jgi:HSP20 family protein|nr:Hsp20/alpha crystallin family protein [Nitrososphaeraceae archaeon]MDW3603643.1 Hsp20/alpha crystallin family protein [Nitrososphaeraceae archaeon]MDW3611047.1 Hsp20/alpha crystallin family protein [Nitrososphaeraceae archaeon]MDW3625061.1 Hsp20/alpha crystallin family protein [Nitrososphaeraceae archaeon]HEX5982253.1 archaeal heat shock protein Hsp14 [Nitrososphaeraceae archaeon]
MGIATYMAKEVMKEINNKSKEFYEFILPPVDMVEDSNDLLVIIDLPGFNKNDITLRINKNVLSIKANKPDNEYRGTVYLKHRPTKIDKKVILPFLVDEDEEITGTANYSDGIIMLRIPSKNLGNRIPIS